MKNYTEETISAEVSRLKPWYHNIELPFGVVTPGNGYYELWEIIRKSRSHIDYSGKTVLDLATYDGMWAFEAEKLGASLVIAADCMWKSARNFLFCREVLGSNVVPLFNVPPHDLSRLDAYLEGSRMIGAGPFKEDVDSRFDIIQNLGLFYHLVNPVLSLQQCRSIIKPGGLLLFETAFCNRPDPVMIFNFGSNRFYDAPGNWWAPSPSCITEILAVCGFREIEKTRHSYFQGKDVGRISIVAEAIKKEGMDREVAAEMENTFRTPGIDRF